MSSMSDYSVLKHLLINTAQLINKGLTTLIDKDASFWQQGMRDISSDGVNPRKWHRYGICLCVGITAGQGLH